MQATLPQPPHAITNKLFYANLQRQFKSNSRLCYNYSKPSHLKAEYPKLKKLSQVFKINEENRFKEVNEDKLEGLGKEEPQAKTLLQGICLIRL